MKVRHGSPWFLFLIRLRGMAPKAGAIYTWGDTIYAPGPLTQDLIAHEKTHSLQQAGFLGPLKWWVRYLFNPAFRLEQEVAAYSVQLRFIRDRVPRRVALQVLYSMADTLASPMYALGLTDASAMACIQDRVHADDTRG